MDSAPGTSFKKETASSSSKKGKKTSLKQLLQSKPLFVDQDKQQPSTSSPVENISRNVISRDNEYVLHPGYTFFEEPNLQEYYEDFKSSATDKIFMTNSELGDISFIFNKKPVIRNNYTQYSFVKVPTLALTTNAYGFIIGNSEQFTERTSLPNLAALEAKHRVSLLLPTADHWWNKNSASAFRSFILQVGNSIRSLAMDEEFKSAMHRFRHDKDVLIDFKNKYLSATKTINNETVPAVFGVKVYNSNQFNSELNLSMAQIMDDNSLEESSGSDLVPPTYMHALLLLSVGGFKITKSGISLDTEVNYLLYRTFKKIERTKQSPFKLNKHVIQKRGLSSSTSLDSSSNLSDVDEEGPSLKKSNKSDAFELQW